MKKIIFAVLALVGLTASAQFDTVMCDTRCPRYYYTSSEWYDSTPCYPDNLYVSSNGGMGPSNDPNGVLLHYHHTDHPITLYGLAGLIDDWSTMIAPPPNIQSIPEHFVLYRFDSAQGNFVIIDSARWDTVQLKVMTIHVPNNHYNGVQGWGDYISNWLREAYFDKPVTVNGDFWIGGTFKRNRGGGGLFTGYCSMMQDEQLISGSDSCSAKHQYRWSQNGVWHTIDAFEGYTLSCFYGIVGDYTVTALTSDSTKGTVSGGGMYGRNSWVTITAHPDSLHSFSHWNDGVTQNPRSFILTQDTTFVAYFDTVSYHKVGVGVNDPALGHGEGGGYYPKRSRVTISAVADSGCRFVSWSDGVSDNPRTITVTQDTTFLALLVGLGVREAAQEDALTVTPNPTTGKATLGSASPILSVEVYAMSGQRVRQCAGGGLALELDLSDLPSGTYLLRIRTEAGVVSRKLTVM